MKPEPMMPTPTSSTATSLRDAPAIVGAGAMPTMLAGAPRGGQIKRSDQPGPLPARIGWLVVDGEVEDLSLELRDVGIRGVPLDGSEGKRIASTARSLELL